MVPFAGYDMPVQYGSVIREAKAVRESVGMFDVSHMARLWIAGERALEFLEWVTTNDVSRLTPGNGQYSLLPNERGGCVDDVIVYRTAPNIFRMVVNASNHAKDVAWLTAQNKFAAELGDDTSETAMIAVQGPEALRVVSSLSDRSDELGEAPAFGVVECSVADVPCFAARSGYTGEDGFELICPSTGATRLWESLLAAGVMPCGLASRDTLRVEAGLPLYGHELSDELSPIAAGLGWVIGKEKRFIGSELISQARREGTPQKLQGIRLGSKRLLAPGMDVYVDGKRVGAVTSGVYSVVLDCGIAFAYLDASVAHETSCEVDVRGRLEPGTVVGKRFYRR